ncbi:MAG: hypothetical protein GY866_30575, partial [Proteobacteria bacterium]|nr:hypothetical protein [Pseudomonadota bacterium]
MKQLTAICFCLVLVVIGPVKALADDFGTLVYVVGEVEIRKKSSHFWAVSKSGDRLDTGDVVKTAVNSTALLLNPDGSLT